MNDSTKINDILKNPLFKGIGQFLFPADFYSREHEYCPPDLPQTIRTHASHGPYLHPEQKPSLHVPAISQAPMPTYIKKKSSYYLD